VSEAKEQGDVAPSRKRPVRSGPEKMGLPVDGRRGLFRGRRMEESAVTTSSSRWSDTELMGSIAETGDEG
jgi:hypothetical protein